MTKLLQHHLERVQQRMKTQADKGRTERSFEVGDWVYLKLQPYLQSSVESRANHKLSFRFYGPYQVEQRVGDVAYKLKLPPTSMIHPVIHVSQLKKSVANDTLVFSELPVEPPALQVPEKILAKRRRQMGASVRNEVMVRWTGLTDSLATWENLQVLRQRFPEAPAWGQAGSEEEGDVTNQERRSRRAERRKKEAEVMRSGTKEEVAQLRKSKRERRRAARFSGPDWTT